MYFQFLFVLDIKLTKFIHCGEVTSICVHVIPWNYWNYYEHIC